MGGVDAPSSNKHIPATLTGLFALLMPSDVGHFAQREIFTPSSGT